MHFFRKLLLLFVCCWVASWFNPACAQIDTTKRTSLPDTAKVSPNSTGQAATASTLSCVSFIGVSISASTTPICAGTPVTFTVSATPPAGYTLLPKWLVNGVVVQTGGTTFTTSSLTSGATVSCTETATSHLVGCTAFDEESNTITVTSSPSAPSGNQQLCQGSGPTTYTTNAAGVSNFTWSISPASAGTISGTGSTGTVAWNNSFSGNATIGVIANGCGTMASTTVTVSATVTPPTALSGTTAPCQGTAVAYSASGGGATSYSWTVSPVSAGTISGSTITWSSSFNGAATVSVVSNGCGGPSALTNFPITVGANAGLPAAPSGPVQVSQGNAPTSYTTTATGASSYTWSISPGNAGTISGTGATGIVTWNTNFSGNATIGVAANGCSGATAVVSISVSVVDPASLNFIRTRTITRPGITDLASAAVLTDPRDVQQTTQYFDGLGRSIQTVAKAITPAGHDLVSPQEYDPFGREVKHYLPYVSLSSDGNYRVDAFEEQNTFNTTQFPGVQYYSGRTDFEPSPLNRPVANYSAGNSWVGASRGVATEYLVNTIADSVQIWNISLAVGSLPLNAGVYQAGQLYMTTTTDEQQHTVVEYKDKDGHVVLKKVQLWDTPASGPSGWLNTYYVYDDLGNLRFVIPPKAVEWLMANSWSFSGTTGSQVSTGLCFRYEYDSRNRMIIKQVPDAGETWTVYDARDRVVMVQDQNHRGTSWVIHKYDNLNREDSMGVLNDANTRDYHQNLAGSSSTYPAIGGTGYTPGIRTFYDDYSWVAGTASGLNSTYATRYSGNSDYFILTPNVGPIYAQPLTPSPTTRGQVTGQGINIIGSNMLFKVHFYDDRSRLLQTISTTWPAGRDTTSFQYDFTGKVLRKLVNQNDPGIVNSPTAYTASTKMGYDAMGRQTSTWMRMGGETSDHLIDSMKYNELGQLSSKTLGNFLDNQVYEYNIRGWLKGINREYIRGHTQNYFAEELGYDSIGSAAAGNNFHGLQYNGNIAGQVWKSAGDGVNRKYDFSYDNINRLLDAGFLQSNAGGTWNKDTIDFSVHNLGYDANGNILRMDQYGFKLGGSGAIDQLIYGYVANSNRLNTVVDSANDISSTLGDFHYNSTRTGQDYRYDAMGNMGVDKNKGITGISHDYLELPEYFQVPGKGSIQITYSADGNKVRKIVWDSVTKHVNITFYNGEFVYNEPDSFVHRSTTKDTLQFLQHAEGRVRLAQHYYTNGTTGYGWEYDFMERDHLGNTRVLLTQEKDTAQYMATMEAAYRPTELALFYNIDSTSAAKPAGYPTDGTTNPNDSVAMVDGNTHKMGPALLLKVMSGDTVTICVKSYYKSNGTNSGGDGSSLQSILNSLAGGLSSLAGPGHGAAATLGSSSGPLSSALNSFLPAQEADTSGKPKAYLNWMLLDNQFAYVSGGGQSGAKRVLNPDAIQALATAINVNHSGYLYIWVSNETKGWPVFFDNLSVCHRSGPMLEENHYYPFGLTMAGISDKAIKSNYAENKYRYNKGSELQNKEFADGSGLELYETPLRSLDPQLGRWWQIDSKPDYAQSLYSAMGNNPILYNDVLGDSAGKPQSQPQNQVHGQFVTLGGKLFNNSKQFDQVTKRTNAINSANEKSRPTGPVVTAALTAGGVGLEGKIANVGVTGYVSSNETDILGIRDNKVVNSSGPTYRNGLGTAIGGFGQEMIGETNNPVHPDQPDPVGTTYSGSIKQSVPFYSAVEAPDGKGSMQFKGTEVNLFSLKVGLGIGVDISVNINFGPSFGPTPDMITNPSESTQKRIFVPNVK